MSGIKEKHMVKIILKEPVGGAIGPGPTAFRQAMFVMVNEPFESVTLGFVSDCRELVLTQAVWNVGIHKWLSNGLKVAIPVSNIAFKLEWSPDVGA